MGTYARTKELENGFPVYKKVDGPQQLYVDSKGFWSVRKDATLLAACVRSDVLFHEQRKPTPALPPSSGWRYLEKRDYKFKLDLLLTATVVDSGEK